MRFLHSNAKPKVLVSADEENDLKTVILVYANTALAKLWLERRWSICQFFNGSKLTTSPTDIADGNSLAGYC